MKRRLGWVVLGAGMLVAPPPSAAQAPGTMTHVQVRALAHDAKLIGDAVGGARVTVTDGATGEVLARGVTTGGTGDTRLIMRTPHERGGSYFSTPGAAGFAASFRLLRPTRVEIAVTGPLGYPQATARASTSMLLEPGADLEGDGVVLELRGLIVELLEAGSGPSGTRIPVRARVRMLCSCPTEPAGLWSLDRVVAQLLDGEKVVAESPLAYAGETSVYAGSVRAPAPGAYTLVVTAAEKGGENAGTVSTSVSVP